MIRRALFAIALLGLATIGALLPYEVQAFRHRGGAATPVTPPSYTYPGDVSGANFTTAWPLFAFTSAKASAGPSTVAVLDVRGSTTLTTCTIYLLGNGTPYTDLTTSGAGGVGNQCVGGARTFCSITNPRCTIRNVYDATGGGQNCSTQIGTMYLALDQPSSGMIAIDSPPASGEINWCLAPNSFAPATGIESLAFFGERTNTTGYMVSIAVGDGGSTIEPGGSTNWRTGVADGDTCAGCLAQTVSINAWHSALSVVNSTSILNIDGTENSGTITHFPYTTPHKPFAFTNNNATGGGGTHSYGAFAGFADDVQWSQATRQAICHSLYQIEGQITPGTYC